MELETDDDLRDAIENNILYFLAMLRTAIPAVIISYDGLDATVQPVVHKLRNNGKTLDNPKIDHVPVMHMGTDDARITTPVKAGTTGLIIFCERNISRWLNSGEESTAPDRRKHDYNDAVFLTGLQPFSSKKVSITDLVIEMNYNTGSPTEIRLKENKDIVLTSPTKIICEAPLIELGKGATESVIKGDAFKALYNGHTHLTPTGPSGVPVDQMDLVPDTHTSAIVTTL